MLSLGSEKLRLILRVGNQDATIYVPEDFRMTKANEIVERTGIGNNDHACAYRVLVASSRSNVPRSVSKS